MRFDPSVENKHIDVIYMDFKFGEVIIYEHGIFFKHITIILSYVIVVLRVLHVRW